MKQYLDEIIRKKENGLYICPLPTGYGKSYEIFRKIAELVKDKRLDGISDIRDESNRQGMRIVIELKRDANANVVLNKLYS